jgi:probable HAF family extracellular repeat protein
MRAIHSMSCATSAALVATTSLLIPLLACNDATQPVQSPIITALAIAPAGPIDLDVHASVTLQAMETRADGTIIPVPEATWSTSDRSILVVDATGRVTSAKSGDATVMANLSGMAARVQIIVRSTAPVASVSIVGQASTLTVGTAEVLRVATLDSAGNLTTTRQATWAITHHGAVAFDTASATVRGIAPGVDTVSAKAEGRTGVLVLRVEARPQILDLGTLGGRSSAASAINASGVVIGWSETASGATHAFRWTATKGMVELGMPPGAVMSTASGINDAGEIVGWMQQVNGARRAVRWTPDGKVSLLIPDTTKPPSVAIAVNASGVVVGQFDAEAAYWGTDGTVRTLTFAHDPHVDYATGINSHGVVVAQDGNMDDSRSFVWSSSGRTDMRPGFFAVTLNDAGVVVGSASTNGVSAATMWSRSGGEVSLGRLPGDASSVANAINSSGAIVGVSSDSSWSANHAFIWTHASGITALGELPGGATSGASSINDAGQVVGWSGLGRGSEPMRAVIWSPRIATVRHSRR